MPEHKEPCTHVSGNGWPCSRELGHDGAHWLAPPEDDAGLHPNVRRERRGAEALPDPGPRPTEPRGIALALAEPPAGRIAAAIVYLADTLKGKS